MRSLNGKTGMDAGGLTVAMKDRKNYGGTYRLGGSAVRCYTARQMKSLYPAGDFHRAGEYAPDSKKQRMGTVRLGSKELPLSAYGTNNRFLYREAGWIALKEGEDGYAVLLKRAAGVRTAGIAACAALVIAGAVLALNWGKAVDASADRAALELEENAEDWAGARTADTEGTAGIAIPGFKSMTVDADKQAAHVNLFNPEGNPCYFVISLQLDDGTVLYKSKMVEPGKGLYDITLSKPLPPGEYGAFVKYETFSLQDLSPMNGAQVKITLIAQ